MADMRDRFLGVYAWAREMAHHPVKILWLSLAGAAVGVVLDGTAIRLWSLHREHDAIQGRLAAARVRTREMDFKIHEAQQPEFIERAARDQFDLVKEGDLVFIFSDESGSEPTENTEKFFN
jgi:cell division protein FtsB